MIILAVAGNETTRNAITHGMNAFLDNPDQWELWKRERPATMVDEVVRWARRSTSFQRTALNDVEVGGVAGQEGPARRAVLRQRELRRGRLRRPVHASTSPATPTRTSAFGGHGAHYCIGANLARQEVRLIFNALADHAPDITKLGEPRRLRHGWINGIKDLQVTYA